MRHPTDGVLRRLVDEPEGVPDDLRAHVRTCPSCAAALDRARADATVTSAALARPTVAPAGVEHRLDRADVDAAWSRLRGAAAAGAVPVRAPARRRTARLRRPAVAVVAAVAVLAGAGAAAAAEWLPIFSTQRVAVVPVSTTDLVQLPDLSRYGDFAVSGQPKPREVADAAAARAATGLVLPEVDPPSGVSGDPRYEVMSKVTATFTFSAAKAAAAAAAAGQQAPPVPAGLDGSRFRLVVGPAAAQIWMRSSGIPALVVARVAGPTIATSGVPYDTVRDYLLSLPGLPADLAQQLRMLSADAGTLPLPVPAGQVTSSSTQVGGVPATVLTAKGGTMAAVVWVDSGIVTGVAGTLPADELLVVARGLR